MTPSQCISAWGIRFGEPRTWLESRGTHQLAPFDTVRSDSTTVLQHRSCVREFMAQDLHMVEAARKEQGPKLDAPGADQPTGN
jgi:hypothetical protein